MLKLVIFDLSGVLSSIEEIIYLKEFCKKIGIKYAEFEKIYFSYLELSEKGQIPLSEVYKKTFQRFNIITNYKEHVSDMMALKHFDKSALKFVENIGKSYWTAYFTNYAEEYWNYVEKMINFPKFFDFGIVSYQIGTRKPEKYGFDIILDRFNCQPSDTLFIDDSPKNIDNAKKLNINTILFKNLDQLKSDFVKFSK